MARKARDIDGEDELTEAFKSAFDKENVGMINANEIKHVLL